MRMIMGERRMPVGMAVRRGSVQPWGVFVLVVLVVSVQVIVLQGFMSMEVRVAGPHKQSHTKRHDQQRDHLSNAQPFPQDDHGRERAHERSRGEESRFSGGSEQPQRIHVQEDAHAIAGKSHQPGEQQVAPARHLRAHHKSKSHVAGTSP